MVARQGDNNDDDSPTSARHPDPVQQRSGPLGADLLDATVYVQRDHCGSGLLLHERSDRSRWVHAYTVPDWVPGGVLGEDVAYDGLTGRQLVMVLPATVGVRLDEGHPHARDVVLPLTDHDHGRDLGSGADGVPRTPDDPWQKVAAIRTQAALVYSDATELEQLGLTLSGRDLATVDHADLVSYVIWLSQFASHTALVVANWGMGLAAYAESSVRSAGMTPDDQMPPPTAPARRVRRRRPRS